LKPIIQVSSVITLYCVAMDFKLYNIYGIKSHILSEHPIKFDVTKQIGKYAFSRLYFLTY